jgi:membrane-bound metal-dependent hydrolase YbcI (DUF457 family)
MLSFPTHFLIGAALSYLFGFSLLFGALGGMAPDLDYFTPWHRGPFHGLLVAPLAAAVIYLLTRSKKKSLGFGIGFAIHPIADWVDYIGVMIAWPFSDSMLSLDIATWNDPVTNGGFSLISILLIIVLKKHREKLTWMETVKSFWPKKSVYKHINTKKTKLKG